MVDQYYDVTLDGRVLFTGTNLEIARRYGLQQSFRANQFISRGWKLKRIYTLVPHKTDVPIVTDPLYEQIKDSLKMNGNTICPKKNKDRIVKKLEENGIKVDATMMSDRWGYVLWAV